MFSSLHPYALLAILLLTGCSTPAGNLPSAPVLESVKNTEGLPVGQVRIMRLPYLENQRIHESSGIAESQRKPGVFWTHNDSGDRPFIYAFDETGKNLGMFEVRGAAARDWEDLSSVTMNGTPYLLIADTGDNSKRRKSCAIYLVPEPVINTNAEPVISRTETARRIQFTYDDGPHNTEAVAMDPETGRIYLVTKRGSAAAGVYELKDTEPYIARRIATMDIRRVTAMDITRDGKRAVLLTYDDAFEFKHAQNESWEDTFRSPPLHLPMPWRPQGESVCYSADGHVLFLTSEGSPTPFWKVEIVNAPESFE